MAGAIVQSVYSVDDSGGSSTTQAVTITGVAAGSALVAFAGWSGSGGAPTGSVTDGTAYTADTAGRILNATDNQYGQAFYLPNAGAGSHTVTLTLSPTTSFRRLRVFEISGIAASGSEDRAAAQDQTTVGTTTDSISSSATAATTQADDFVLGMTQDTLNVDPGSGTMAAGTGYALSGANQILSAEGKNVAATGAQTATFTDTKNSNRTTHVLALKQLIGPTITTHPTDKTVKIGATAAFTVAATGTGGITYQWQKQQGGAWSDIGGAISTTYTTPTLTASDSAGYRCNCTDTIATTASNAASLTVSRAMKPFRVARTAIAGGVGAR